ncbi:hypothetical protein ACLOJK_017884 [Asimina triloba]
MHPPIVIPPHCEFVTCQVAHPQFAKKRRLLSSTPLTYNIRHPTPHSRALSTHQDSAGEIREAERERQQRPAQHSMKTSTHPPPLPRVLSISILVVISIQLISSHTVNAGGHHQLGWAASTKPPASCRGGSIGMGGCEDSWADEFAMDSEINRRVLATSQYISYEALKRDSVPCSRRGQSYYNCQPNAQANPYVRGCSQITQCRS